MSSTSRTRRSASSSQARAREPRGSDPPRASAGRSRAAARPPSLDSPASVSRRRLRPGAVAGSGAARARPAGRLPARAARGGGPRPQRRPWPRAPRRHAPLASARCRARNSASVGHPGQREVELAALPRPRALLGRGGQQRVRRANAGHRRRPADRRIDRVRHGAGAADRTSSRCARSALSATASSSLRYRTGQPRDARAEQVLDRVRAPGCPRRSRAARRSASVRPTSSANSGLPSVASTMRRRTAAKAQTEPLEEQPARRAETSGPTSSRSSPADSSARSSADGATGPPGEQEADRLTSSRRAANASASQDGASSHWSRRPRPAPARAREPAQRVEEPSAIACARGGAHSRRLGPSSATSNACALRTRHRRKLPSSIPSRRSHQPREGELRLGAPRRAGRTRNPRSRAAAIPASHNVVLPMPGPPASTNDRDGGSPSNSSWTRVNSRSRPTIPAAPSSIAPTIADHKCPPARPVKD